MGTALTGCLLDWKCGPAAARAPAWGSWEGPGLPHVRTPGGGLGPVPALPGSFILFISFPVLRPLFYLFILVVDVVDARWPGKQ